MTPTSLVAAVDDLAERFRATSALVEGMLGAVPRADQLEAVRGALAGYEVEIRALLRDLDPHDEIADWLLVEEGARTIAMWRWRRQTRSALVAVWGRVHATAAVAGELRGTRDRVVVVRDGDTWQSIAQRELGGWREWPRLLEANPGLSAGALTSGTSIVVPNLR